MRPAVTLSGAIAESKGLEFAEHAPVRFVRIYANPPSGPLDCARGDSLCCHVERSDSEVETSRLDGTFTFTNHTRNAQNAETNINDRSRCSIIPRLERGTPAVDGPVPYHSTFSNLDGGAFQLFSATFHTVGRHALVLSSISGGHAVLTAPFHDGRPPNGFIILINWLLLNIAILTRSCHPSSFGSWPCRQRMSAGLGCFCGGKLQGNLLLPPLFTIFVL